MQNKKIIKLILVAGGDGKNNNKFYNMYDNNDGTMYVEYGRVKKTKIRKDYSINKWDSIYRAKTKKGYKDITELYEEVHEQNSKPKKYKDISNIKIRNIFNRLQEYANIVVKKQYTVTSTNVSQKMIDNAQLLIDKINKNLNKQSDYNELNSYLLELFSVIPRQMQKVEHYLFKDLSNDNNFKEAQKIISDEQDTLDSMAGQVLANSKQSNKKLDDSQDRTSNNTILEKLGLELYEITPSEEKDIKKALANYAGKFKQAFKVINKETENNYKNHVSKFDNISIREELFWHGSRNQNWYFILQKGLLIRPSGAVHTGSMFGDGIYFANKAQKSAGYSSLRGSYWTSGHDTSGFLAIYAVNVGKQKIIKRHNHSCYSLSKRTLDKEKFDSVYAQGGIDLRNDEFIIYENNKCTIRYLVELAN